MSYTSDARSYSSAPSGPAPERSRRSIRGGLHAQTSLIFGVLGLAVMGIAFGPLAIAEARKARHHNVRASAGLILGWTGLAVGIVATAWFVSLLASTGA